MNNTVESGGKLTEYVCERGRSILGIFVSLSRELFYEWGCWFVNFPVGHISLGLNLISLGLLVYGFLGHNYMARSCDRFV